MAIDCGSSAGFQGQRRRSNREKLGRRKQEALPARESHRCDALRETSQSRQLPCCRGESVGWQLREARTKRSSISATASGCRPNKVDSTCRLSVRRRVMREPRGPMLSSFVISTRSSAPLPPSVCGHSLESPRKAARSEPASGAGLSGFHVLCIRHAAHAVRLPANRNDQYNGRSPSYYR
jgi:hypothetical protein